MKTKIFFLLIIILNCGNLLADDEMNMTSLYPIKLPQSPNIAEFPSYSSIPINYYTGTMSLSIPIYEIDVDGCKIPITATYNANGIKVSQHASNIGLGWALNCGGFIMSDCYGNNDFDCLNDGYGCNHFVNGIPEDSVLHYYMKTNKGVDISQMDTRPDIYHYTFCENNGDMIFPPREFQHPILIKSDKYLDITYVRDFQTWTIYDGNGNMFHFGNKPHVAMNVLFRNPPTFDCESSLVTEDDPSKGGYNWDYRSINAWPLDTIKTINGRTIIFKYKRETILTPMMPSEEIRIAHQADYGLCEVSRRRNYLSHSAANIIQIVPTEILFPNGKVTFYSSRRSDIWEGLYAVYDDTEAPTKIDSILVSDIAGKVIRRAIFYYHYEGNTESPNTCRLILDSIGGLEPQAYKFTYYNLQLPKKNSNQIDMWGYFNNSTAQSTWSTTLSNNKTAEGTLVPSMIIDNRTFFGRNRQCNSQTISNAALKEVIYPTGGRSVFEYEPHTFPAIQTDAEVIDDELITKTTCLILSVNHTKGNLVTVSTPAEIRQVTLDDYETIDIHVTSEVILEGPSSPVGIASLKIETMNGTTVFQENIMIYTNKHEYTFHPFLEPGTYNISFTHNGTSSIEIPHDPNIEKSTIIICGEIGLKKKNRGGNYISMGGGLRIKSIINYDISNEVAQKREFQYQLNDSTSSGKLFVSPKFSHIYIEENLHQTDPSQFPCGWFVYTLLSSSMLVPAQPMINSSVVGYSKITESIHPITEFGKIEYTYLNPGANSPSEYPNFISVSLPQNGTLSMQNIYDANGKLCQQKEYSYTYDWKKEIDGLHTIKLFPERYYLRAEQQANNVPMFKYSIKTFSHSEKIVKTTDFYDNGALITNYINEYDSVTFLPQYNYIYTKDDTIKQLIVYPSQENSSSATILKNYHLYNKPLRQENYRNSYKTMITDYLYENEKLKELRQIKDSHTDSILVYSVKNYDTYNNPTSIVSHSGIITSYLWGCRGMYPLIEVVGVEYDALESSFSPSFLTMLKNTCEVSISILRSIYDTLSQSVPQSKIHLYSYYPLVGLAAEIDSRGIVYSYEYDEYNRLSAKYIETDSTRFILEKYTYHFQTNE